MKIDCTGTIGMVYTKQKPYKHTRKGYWVKDRYVKAKTITKYKTVLLKEPYLSGDIQLKVDENLLLGGVYADQTGRQYCCTSKQSFGESESTLRVLSMNLGKTFQYPKSLHQVAKAAFQTELIQSS